MATWPFRHEIVVTWADMDAAGHVNNARYFTYMETARAALHLGLTGATRWQDLDIILARAACDFRSPATFGETVVVEAWPTRVGRTSYALAYRLTDKASGRVVADAESVQVAFDYKRNEKKELPPEVRRELGSGLQRSAMT